MSDPRPISEASRITIAFLIWLFTGYFLLFACNGGAGGSSKVTGFAWSCLAVYTAIFVFFYVITRRTPGRRA